MATIVLEDVNGVKVERKNVVMEEFPVLEGRVVCFVDEDTGEHVGAYWIIPEYLKEK